MRDYARAIVGGLIVGALMGLLVWKGNPGHMGICGACFSRDLAGAIGLHAAAPVKYVRPEIVGLIVGALLSALVAREYRARGGGAPIFKFLMGAWVTIGALVFLGCPFRMIQRIGGGDVNAMIASAGLVAGIAIALGLTRAGVQAGRATPQPPATGFLLPLVLVGLLVAMVLKAPRIVSSAPHAPWLVSLGAALAAGVILQRTRFCTLGAFRNVVFYRDPLFFAMLLSIAVAYGAVSAATGKFHLGMEQQPIAHTNLLWNVAPMVLVGLAGSLAGGCPARQMVMAGEGDTDAALTFIGMVAGGGFAHTFNLASSPAGPTVSGKIAVGIGMAFCLGAAWMMRTRNA